MQTHNIFVFLNLIFCCFKICGHYCFLFCLSNLLQISLEFNSPLTSIFESNSIIFVNSVERVAYQLKLLSFTFLTTLSDPQLATVLKKKNFYFPVSLFLENEPKPYHTYQNTIIFFLSLFLSSKHTLSYPNTDSNEHSHTQN